MESIVERLGQGFALPFLVLMLALILGPRLAARVRLPATVGLVLAGMIVGPHGVGLLNGNEIALQAWGTFGLLYLMFSAALELDLRSLGKMKGAAITFALLSFAIPFTLGVLSARLLGYALAAAVLMGANWGSHTLVTYPMLHALGLGRNRAVATVVGATALTDTLALLVLTGVSVSVRHAGTLGAEWASIAIGFGVLLIWTLLVLPKVARWFFAKVGGERSYRLVFGMTAFLSGAVLAEASSIDGIIGSFFAGLGMTRVIPERSELMDRVQFFGLALFIPTFLVSVGVLLEPRALLVPKTLFLAAVFTVVVLGGKALAAIIAGRAFHFSSAEVGVMSGLSGSQAAATLATTLIGLKLRVFNRPTFDAVLVVVLASLIVTPAVVSRFSKRVAHREVSAIALGSSVLVSVRDERTRPLLGVAARIAAPDGGIVVAVSLATEEASSERLADQRHLAAAAGEWLAREGFEARAVFRVAPSVEAGLRDTILGEEATLLVVESRSCQRGEIERDAARIEQCSPVPGLLAHGDVQNFDRVLVIVRPTEIVRPAGLELTLANIVARRLAQSQRVIYVVRRWASLASPFGSTRHLAHVDVEDPIGWLRDELADGDLVVLPGLDVAREALERVDGLSEKRFLVAIAARDRTNLLAEEHATATRPRRTRRSRAT
jgi:Kef-type K+ transport system membrane component KefB